MRTNKIVPMFLAAAGLLLAAGLPAQNPPPANSTATPPAAAKPAPAAKSTHTPAAKTGTSGAAKSKPAPLTLTTQGQKVSYAIGMSIGKNLKRDSVEVDPAILLRGLKDAIAGNKMLLTDDEVKAALTQLQADLRAKAEEKAKVAALENKMKSDAYLAANKAKEGVVTLPSGLQYKIIKQGTGPKPTAEDTVECNYRGTFIDGTEFDSSTKHGQAIKIPVGRVIKGWTEALQLMPVGSKWQLFIPPDLAYGEHSPPGIEPNSTLLFDVELLSIEPPQPKEPPKEAPKPSQPEQKGPPPAEPPKEQPKPQPPPTQPKP